MCNGCNASLRLLGAAEGGGGVWGTLRNDVVRFTFLHLTLAAAVRRLLAAQLGCVLLHETRLGVHLVFLPYVDLVVGRFT